MSELISLNMGNLTAAVDPMGAQLCSLKLNQNEYLWQATQLSGRAVRQFCFL